MTTATQTGADPDIKEGEVSVNTGMSPRDVALAAMEQRTDEAHSAQIKEDVENDPGIAHIHDTITAQQNQRREEAVKAGRIPPLDDGAASREPMHVEQPVASAPGAIPAELQADPLASNIVMDDGKPMFALKINGENVLMPLDEAKRKLQIGTAAEIRMQSAASKEKELVQREQRIAAGESALSVRVNAQPQEIPSIPAPVVGLSEAEIRSQATDVFKTAFAGTEEDAADKLTKLLLSARTPVVAPPAPIDEAAIVNRASAAAVTAVTAVNAKRDLRDGYTVFQEKYPAIMADHMLYNMADGMTDGIVTEHPDWSEGQVMLEAGKRTSEWVEGLRGKTSTEAGDVITSENIEISEQSQPPEIDARQARKAQLVVIPQAAVATQQPVAPEAPPLTPQESLNEVRKARGQPV